MEKVINFASQIKRIFARLFDFFIIFLFFIFIKINLNLKNIKYIEILIYFLIILFLIIFFQIIIPYLNNGKTIGKYIFKIKIINKDNEKLSIFFLIFREFFIFLILMLSFIFWIIFLLLSDYIQWIFELKKNDLKEIHNFFVKVIITFNVFWIFFIFIFQKINPLNRLFYDKYWDVFIVSETKKFWNKKIIKNIKKSEFKEEVKNKMNTFLNNKQLKAVLVSKNNNLRIIAGPGTGKTTVLISRILNFIQNEKIEPERILILTFTKKACKNISDRIKLKIKDFKSKQIFTYHSFCFYFLNEEKDHLSFKVNENLIILDQEDQKSIFKKIIKNDDELFSLNKEMDYSSMNYILDLLNKIRLLLIENFNDFKKEIKNIDFNLTEEKIIFLWKIRCEYKNYKKENKLFDFFDLLKHTYNLLKNDDILLKKWKRRYSQIVIDEFQDTNKIQFLLVSLLSNEGKEIKVSVVGDPDQTIYGWRGADIKYIIDFDKNFVDTKTIILEENYRSTKNIVELSNFFIKKNKNRINKKIISTKNNGTLVQLLIENDYEQAEEIVNQIKTLKNNGVSLNKIAIIYRSHFLSGKIEKELIQNNIEYFIFKGIKFFSRAEIKDFFILLSLMINDNDFGVEKILLWIRNIGTETIKKLKKKAKEEKLTLLELIFKISNKPKFNKISSKINDFFDDFFILRNSLKDIKNFYVLSKNIYEKIYFKIIKEIYFNEKDRIENIKTLLNIIQTFENENSSLKLEEKISMFLKKMNNVYISEELTNNNDFVSLMTVHNTKGLEFDYVFIFNVSNRIFPSMKTKTFLGLEEERRLLFVGMTRAKKMLFITSGYDYSVFIEEIQESKQIKYN